MDPEVAVDVLWQAVRPEDRLEHIRARTGPGAAGIDLAIFLRAEAETPESPSHLSLRLCRRAIEMAPALAGWSAAVLTLPPASTPPA